MTQLQLGIAREIITPAVGGRLYGYDPHIRSTTVNDDLTATAFFFQQGNTRALMISLTICEMQTALAARLRADIEKQFGIPAAHCLLCATHTHSGPNVAGTIGWGDIDAPYCENIFIPAIFRAVKRALHSLTPVKVSVAAGKSHVGINRRELTVENAIVLGQNPWGCLDTTMTILSFFDMTDKPIANMIHYGAHGTAAGPNTEITRDWSGLMTDALEAESGAVTAFFNGTMGDIGPRISNGKTVGDLHYVYELGEIAARDAVAIWHTRSEARHLSLRVSAKTLALPQQPRMPYEEAKTRLSQCRSGSCGENELLRAHLEDVVHSYENGENENTAFASEQILLALGDVVFASFPFEIFSQIGLRCDHAVEGRTVRVLSNVNGFEGYFVTEDALCRGGYEVNIFRYMHRQPFADNADFHLMKQTVDHIEEMKQAQPPV